jgi:hypothetical protein
MITVKNEEDVETFHLWVHRVVKLFAFHFMRQNILSITHLKENDYGAIH